MVEKEQMNESQKDDKENTENRIEPENEEAPSQGKEKKDKKKSSKEELKAQLEAKEKEAQENFDKYLRAKAELENYKKRVEKEKTETIRYCNENIIREILPVVDNLEMALKHGQDSNNSKSLIEGVEIVLNQFLKGLEKFGLASFSSVGEEFDPNRHEAMMQVETDDYRPNSIVSEFQKGYFLHERLLRPAKVTVATPFNKHNKDDQNRIDKDGTESSKN
ncbi:MAG: nucleotide exchange factor GrpE [Thermodesulfobacteriota bacterium]|nr:nucleotide exchange factor GrpE [Thermodesulfobacteriota bacterium]